MPRVVRNRTRTNIQSGTRKSWIDANSSGPPDTTDTSTKVFNSSCGDRVGSPVSDGGFNSSQMVSNLSMSGIVFSDGGRKYLYEDYPVFGQISGYAPLGAHSGWALDLVAGTNPSRPVLTPPEMIQNLIELPKLLRQTFAFLANPRKRVSSFKNVADDYLAFKFGWMPFVKDLSDLLDLQAYVIKRRKELLQLYSGKGLRRRLRFKNETQVLQSKYTEAFDSGASIEFEVLLIVTRKTWGTARWRPTAPPPFALNDEALNQKARQLVLGMTSEGLAKGLWNVIPWTWLLGWFTNVGKFLQVNSNTIPASYSNLNFMSSCDVIRTVGGGKQTKIKYSSLQFAGHQSLRIKTRITSPGVLTPGLSMPDLDIGRLSVLGALAVQRIKR